MSSQIWSDKASPGLPKPLPADVLERLFVEPAESVEAAVAEALAQHGEDATIAVIPKGPYVLAEVA